MQTENTPKYLRTPMTANDTSTTPSSADRTTAELLRLLARMEPLIRRRIREIRGSRDALLSTSGLYTAVVEELIVRETIREASGSGAGPHSLPTSMPNPLRFLRHLSQIIHDSVTRARQAVNRWRQADELPMRLARGTSSELSSSLDRSELRQAMERLIDGISREDREILYLRMKGNPWATVAAVTGMREITCRQRWVRLVAELRRRFPDD